MNTHDSDANLQLDPNTAKDSFVPGGFWIRFVAAIIDGCVVGLINLPISIGMNLAIVLIPENDPNVALILLIVLGCYGLIFFLTVFYYGWFYRNKGATPGKMLFGLRVMDENTGANIGYGKAFLREIVGKMVSGVVLGIGYFIVAFRSDKRALHDFIATTRVVRKVK